MRSCWGQITLQWQKTLTNLAELYRNMGHFKKAEPLTKIALKIKNKAKQEENDFVNNQANTSVGLQNTVGLRQTASY